MDLIRKICLLIILISLSTMFYVFYSYLKYMESFSILNLGEWIKETMKFFVFIVIFGLIIFFTLDVMLKKEEEPRGLFESEKWSALTPSGVAKSSRHAL